MGHDRNQQPTRLYLKKYHLFNNIFDVLDITVVFFYIYPNCYSRLFKITLKSTYRNIADDVVLINML